LTYQLKPRPAWKPKRRVAGEAVLLVDTNILLSAADRSTPEHERCAALLDERTDLPVTIATVNHRDFSVVRPSNCGAFDLIL
jgi:hypothetical protein